MNRSNERDGQNFVGVRNGKEKRANGWKKVVVTWNSIMISVSLSFISGAENNWELNSQLESLKYRSESPNLNIFDEEVKLTLIL